MLNLDVFSPVELRRTRELLSLFDPTMSAADILRAISSAGVEHEARFSAGPELCPSCGRGYLVPVQNNDGLKLVGCRRCRYSREVV